MTLRPRCGALEALREEIRVARRRDREFQAIGARERENETALGAASERAERAERAIQAFDEPLPLTGPLAAGNRSTPRSAYTARSPRSRATRPRSCNMPAAGCAYPSRGFGRRPVASLYPEEADAPVRVLAAARGDVCNSWNVRGQRAQEAREAVRSFVDDAALASLPSVRIVHGRGTGAVRAAVREELDGHPLVERRESDSADGATVAHLAG